MLFYLFIYLFLVDFAGTGHLPLLPDGLLSGGGLVLLQLPKNLSLDHPHLQTGFFLLFQGLWEISRPVCTASPSEHRWASVTTLGLQVIEVFIRAEEGLSRDMVKHLNHIEEQVLESQAWSRDSALWGALQAAGNRVPTVEEVGTRQQSGGFSSGSRRFRTF